MQTAQALPYSHTCIDSGVDWITCTGRGKDARKALEAQGEAILQGETAAGVEIQPAAVRDYVGWRAPGVFSGRRSEDSMVVLSASHAARHWKTVAQVATNVSRLDLQATVWTHGEQPALSRWYYQRVRRQAAKRGRPRSYTLIQTIPEGDTLYVGKRQSDCYGRCYDFAAAHRQGLSRTLWRYEVEFKRHLALLHSRALLTTDRVGTAAESVVHNWFESRGVQPSWTPGLLSHSESLSPTEPIRNILTWFETSLRVTIAKARRRHGLQAVLDALGLSDVVIPIEKGDRMPYASHTTPVVPRSNHR